MINYAQTGSTDPCYNLAFEQYILEHKRDGDWLLLWQNDKTVVIGLNQNAEEELNSGYVAENGVKVVRRMTGGGAVYHDLGNLNYSFITGLGDAERFTLEKFTRPVCQALKRLGIDAAVGGRNDIMVNGKKVSGVAQRICGNRILHHGTLLFDSDLIAMAAALLTDRSKFISKSAKSVHSRVCNLRPLLEQDMDIEQFREALLAELAAGALHCTELTEAEKSQVRREAEERYRSWEWTYGHNPDYSFKNKVCYPGGTLEVRLLVKAGIICQAHFTGDYMALTPGKEAEESLVGCPYDRAAVEKALAGIRLEHVFGSLGKAEVLGAIFPPA